jgi:hypothetical protein
MIVGRNGKNGVGACVRLVRTALADMYVSDARVRVGVLPEHPYRQLIHL